MRSDVARDWKWADSYLPAIHDILKENAAYLIDFEIAHVEADIKEATDMVICLKNDAAIAVRMRRSHYKYRDLTIRSWRESGTETELQKIKRGFVDFYLYGWTDEKFGILDWMLIDVESLRQSGWLETKPMIPNRDNKTGFIAISYQELRDTHCIINASMLHWR
jgi:hypothetical protein